ncbi:unnamed protein product, partial [marine sediment metagenome]
MEKEKQIKKALKEMNVEFNTNNAITLNYKSR